VVGTYDGSALRIYVDNVLRATTNASGAIPTTTEPLAIGNKPTSTDSRDPFAGVIDDVSIHATALSAAQIGQLWTAGTNPPTGNQAPTAVASANPTSGQAPLTVTFNGTASSDPDPGDTLTYSWDLNGDGTFGDSTVSQPVFTYQSAGTFTAALRVTDNHGAPSAPATVPITVTTAPNTPPVPVIATPTEGTPWSVGEVISFSGSATDAEDSIVRRAATLTTSRRSRGSRPARSSLRTTSTPPTWS
jgi:PKD repeat protein